MPIYYTLIANKIDNVICEYTDKEGVKRYSTDVISEKIIPLDSTGEGSNYAENNSTETGTVNEIPPVESNDDLPF